MRFDRSLTPALLLTTFVVGGVCMGEVSPVRPAEEPDTAVAAYREQRLEWTDNRVKEVVIASPPWQEVVPVNAPPAPDDRGAQSALLATGIPETAMASYTAAANNLAEEDPTCGLPWSVLAAIGRVESNHGRYGGAQLHTDGSIRPVIRGIALDGRPGVAVIDDSDGGGLDGDRTFDRAIGPMQFIPSTWRGWASDGNADSVRDPDNMFDATLAAARYLCAGDVDTRSDEGLRSAIFRYNQSEDYVSAVVAIAKAYRDNETPVIPDPASAEPTEAPPVEAPPVEAPMVTTTPQPSSVTTTPSTEPSTTEPSHPAHEPLCAVTPNTSPAPSSSLPWIPTMPVVTCKPRTPTPTPETTPTPTPSS